MIKCFRHFFCVPWITPEKRSLTKRKSSVFCKINARGGARGRAGKISKKEEANLNTNIVEEEKEDEDESRSRRMVRMIRMRRRKSRKLARALQWRFFCPLYHYI